MQSGPFREADSAANLRAPEATAACYEALAIALELSCTQCGRLNEVNAPVARFICRHCGLESAARLDSWACAFHGAAEQTTSTGFSASYSEDTKSDSHRVVFYAEDAKREGQRVVFTRWRLRLSCAHCGGAPSTAENGVVCERCREPMADAPPPWLSRLYPALVGLVARTTDKDATALVAIFFISDDPRRSLHFAIPATDRTARLRQKEVNLSENAGCARTLAAMLVVVAVCGIIGTLGNLVFGDKRSDWSLLRALYGVPPLLLLSKWQSCKQRKLAHRLAKIAGSTVKVEEAVEHALKRNELVGRIGEPVRDEHYEVLLTPPGRPDDVLARMTVQIPPSDYERLGGHGAPVRAFLAPPPRARSFVLLQPTSLE